MTQEHLLQFAQGSDMTFSFHTRRELLGVMMNFLFLTALIPLVDSSDSNMSRSSLLADMSSILMMSELTASLFFSKKPEEGEKKATTKYYCAHEHLALAEVLIFAVCLPTIGVVLNQASEVTNPKVCVTFTPGGDVVLVSFVVLVQLL